MSTFTPQAKSNQETVYLVSEAGDFYLVGSSEDLYLVTAEASNFTGQSRNSITLINQTKN